MADDDALLAEARKAYERCRDAENDNRETYEDDVNFARANEQWDAKIRAQRDKDGRPCLTINKMPAFIRQVVNDARQNKPSIKVHPADSGADPETAEVINGLIRNIEYTSNADVAYDTGVECAVAGGFGYWRIKVDYAFDDAFDMDLLIDRIANPLSVYGDPDSTAADSSDWNVAFVVERMSEDDFKAKYPSAEKVDFEGADWREMGDWKNDEGVLVAEWWTRVEAERTLVLTNKGVFDKEDLENDEDAKFLAEQGVLHIIKERKGKTHRVTQRIMTGAEVLETNKWSGRYIPIVPVYGDEFFIGDKRYLRSLIHNAKDAQQMFNYWRTANTELIALAPRVPFIGPKGAFDSDPNWHTINKASHAFAEYDGQIPPQRQPLDVGGSASAIQEAMNANDDMKAIIGLYDASLGARSNETSGKAIMARQREGDVATFHFIDNLTRAIRHTGRILIDLIPSVYNKERVVRVMGEDGQPENKQVNQPFPAKDPKTGAPMMKPMPGPDGQPMLDPNGDPIMQPVMAMHDLTAGKYDLVVSSGPSFTTRREEATEGMVEMMRSAPQLTPILAPELMKAQDWPGAEKIAEKIDEASKPPEIPDPVKKAMDDMKAEIEKLNQENEKLRTDISVDMEKAKGQNEIARTKVANDYNLGQQKIQQDRQLELARGDAVEVVSPTGEKQVRSKSDMGNEALMQGLATLGQLVVQQGQSLDAQMQQLARIVAAPNELIRDPRTGKASGSRKVMQ